MADIRIVQKKGSDNDVLYMTQQNSAAYLDQMGILCDKQNSPVPVGQLKEYYAMRKDSFSI